MKPETLHVVGAGVMGTGVAQALAQTGHAVVLMDIQDDILARARKGIYDGLRLQMLLQKSGSAPDPEAALQRVEFTTDDRALGDAEFVMENITESWEAKAALYGRMDALCPETCIFASDTSAIPIARLASATNRPDRVVGLHFMNPVSRKPCVEVIRSAQTSEQTLDATRALLEAMGKSWVVVNDSPGFVSNRVLMLTLNEACRLVEEGVAPAQDVDRIFRECFGHAMGPLQTADLIGLDNVLDSIAVLEDALGGDKYRACDMLRGMVARGDLGRKSGRGFYAYATRPDGRAGSTHD